MYIDAFVSSRKKQISTNYNKFAAVNDADIGNIRNAGKQKRETYFKRNREEEARDWKLMHCDFARSGTCMNYFGPYRRRKLRER